MVDQEEKADDQEQPAVGKARECDAPVRPGHHNAAAAYRNGQEDEWIDRMNSRYGGEQ